MKSYIQNDSYDFNNFSFSSMIREIERRKLPVNIKMKASQIYCYFKNDDNNAMELVQVSISK